MKFTPLANILMVFGASCSPNAGQQPAANDGAPSNVVASPEPASAAPVANEYLAAKPESLPEPNGPIDPKSAEAAGQVVQHYGALIEQGQWAKSRDLWSNANAAKAFERTFRDYSEVHLEIGNPGDSEGAAGSIYVTVPAVFYGDLHNGQPARLETDVILRRVNDVPGSTEAQRRWHIERIETAR